MMRILFLSLLVLSFMTTINGEEIHPFNFPEIKEYQIFSKSESKKTHHRGHHCRSHHTSRSLTGPTGPQGIPGPQGPQGIPGPVNPLTNTIFVDAGTTSTNQDGSIGNPYSSIQQAINTIPTPTNLLEKARGFTILVASGIYFEDLVFNMNNTQIEVIALGPVFLVKSVNPFVGANVTINFTATALPEPIAMIGDSVSFSALTGNSFFNNPADIGQTGTFEITGTIFINDTSSVAGVINSVSFRGSNLQGIDGTGSTKAHILELNNGYTAVINSPQSIVNARDSVIATGFTALSYGIIYSCNIINGMTITQPPAIYTMSGAGIYFSTLSGLFNGPAGVGPNAAYLFDAATNYWFNVNAGIINPPASKQVIFDIT